MTLKSDPKFEEKLIVVWKMTWGIWQIFTRSFESVKIWTLMGSFCQRQKTFELKIYTTMENDAKFEEELT